MDSLFSSSDTFSSLSIKDLVKARDLFHYHLMNKKNVVATAIGPYRIRHTDEWPSPSHPQAIKDRQPRSSKRTLANSEVRPYSWPSVYVFVSEWEFEEKLASKNPGDVVPRTLFLPDGRSVPVCVIEAQPNALAADLEINPDRLTPRNLLAPGTPLLNRDGQGMTRLATAGCLVRDGERYYVLTNKHAVGAPGTPIEAFTVNRQRRIGHAALLGLTRENLKDIYPAFRSTNQRLLMDIGLVDVDDVLQWKSEVPGIDPIGPVLDLYDNSFTLKLVTMKVTGQSAMSGRIRGQIDGLFYRYKALGGSEYIADFLIGPETHHLDPNTFVDPKTLEAAQRKKSEENEDASLEVHHGDSGTVLYIEQVLHDPKHPDDKKRDTLLYRPFAVLWGKEELGERVRGSRPYALATSLSTALDRLNLDYVRDLNADETYIWGWVGHYAIGRSLPVPTDLVVSQSLRTFLKGNLDVLAIEPDKALGNDPRVQTKDDPTPRFVALADVPDNVWKSNVNFIVVKVNGKNQHQVGPGARGQTDNPNHFADLDLPYLGNKTFLELNFEEPDKYLNPKEWIAFFASLKTRFDHWDDTLGRPHSKHWGALPFRVHQLFDIMKAAALAKDPKLLLCAGGTLIHYVGDACQPLHASYLSQGDPDDVIEKPGSTKEILRADGVHSGYEDDMVAYGYKNKNLGKELGKAIVEGTDKPKIVTGYDASKAIIELIHLTQKDIPPRDIVDKWVEVKGTQKSQRDAAMWDAFGDQTIAVMARGARYLAAIWQAAWKGGNGDGNIDKDAVVSEADLMALYNRRDVVPSVALDEYPDDPNTDWAKIALKPSHPDNS
jgi:hypothetical protein